MLGVRRLLVELGMPLSSCLCTMTLDTFDFGDACSFCDREDDCLGDLCLTTILSVMSTRVCLQKHASNNILQLTRNFVHSWNLI
jgi:hypothetical protein